VWRNSCNGTSGADDRTVLVFNIFFLIASSHAHVRGNFPSFPKYQLAVRGLMAQAASTSSSAPRMPRDRSRIVCQRCHARKVKCDLINKLRISGSCTNCEKRLEVCRRRGHTRPQKLQGLLSGNHASSDLVLNNAPDTAWPAPSLIDAVTTPPELNHNNESGPRHSQPTPSSSDAQSYERHSAQLASPEDLICGERQQHLVQQSSRAANTQGYVGEFSVLEPYIPPRSESSTFVGSFSRMIEERALIATGAAHSPPQSMVHALSATYFKYLYHRVPVIDRQDITCADPSTLLIQSVCLAGSLLRHPRMTRGVLESEKFYVRAKTLFYLNNENDPLTTVKAMCLLSLWTVTPPTVVTMDCGWNWLGLAIRFALQMGLHRESTYSRRSAPGCARRIAWFLYAQDKLHTACFHRPQMLKAVDFDTHPPTLADFEDSENDQARLFILFSDLMTILAKTLDVQHRVHTLTPEDVLSTLSDLKAWVLKIPPDLRLVDMQGRKIYHREFYEILVWYFTCILTYFHIHGRFFQPSMASRICIVASSCIIRLYQEMDYRDEVTHLGAINNWTMMVASLPQLNSLGRENLNVNIGENTSPSNALSLEELDILMEILTQRTVKYPGAKAIIDRIQHFKREPPSHPLPGLGDATRHPSASTYVPIPNVHDLFPFPKALSPRMELLYTMPEEDLSTRLFESYPDWQMEYLFSVDDISGLFSTDIETLL